MVTKKIIQSKPRVAAPERNTVFKFLLTHADKLLLLAVPYMAAVSFLYYAGYWGSLEIDVYNYFALSDLIKGAAYPMQYALAAATFAAIVDFTMSYVLATLLKGKNSINFLLILMGAFSLVMTSGFWLSVIVVIIMLVRSDEPAGFLAESIPLLNTPFYISLFLFSLGFWFTRKLVPHLAESPVINVEVEDNKAKEEIDKNIAPDFNISISESFTSSLQLYALVFTLFTTPFFSFASGYYNAKHVLSGKSFDYVERRVFIQDGLLTPYPYLKYLGRVGDFHFLLTPDNTRRIIIGKDHWPALLLLSSKTLPHSAGPKQGKPKAQAEAKQGTPAVLQN